jgi:hypothetical protein
MSLWYMSFVDPDKPKGQKWLGGAYVEAPNPHAMLTASHRLGCNPGGEVQFSELPDELASMVPDEKIGVLLDEEGIEL